jgi:hypothetical protein
VGSAINLQYNRTRYYDPSSGRWVSQDSLAFAAGDSNLYRYVNNAPVLAADPTGLYPAPFIGLPWLFGPLPQDPIFGKIIEKYPKLGGPDAKQFNEYGDPDTLFIVGYTPANLWPVDSAVKQGATIFLEPGDFTVPVQPQNIQQLTDMINKAVQLRRGRPFNRIVIWGHQGGSKQSPGVQLGKTQGWQTGKRSGSAPDSPNQPRLSTGTASKSLITAMQAALTRQGYLQLVACNYPDENTSWYKDAQALADQLGVNVVFPTVFVIPGGASGWLGAPKHTGKGDNLLADDFTPVPANLQPPSWVVFPPTRPTNPANPGLGGAKNQP